MSDSKICSRDPRASDFCNERHGALERALDLAAKNQDLKISHLEQAVEGLSKFRDAHEGKASQASVYVAWALSAIGILIALFGLFRRPV